MHKRTARLLLYAELAALDSVAILLGFWIAGHIRGETWISPAGYNLTLLFVPLYLVLALNKNCYGIEVLGNLGESLRRALTTLTITTFNIFMVGFFFQAGTMVSRIAFAVGVGASATLLVLWRTLSYYLTRMRYRDGFIDELLIVDGVSPTGLTPRYVMYAAAEGITPDLDNPLMLNRLATCIVGFDRVVVSCPQERQHAWSLILKGANICGEILVEKANAVGALALDRYGEHETLVVARGPLCMTSRIKKRMLDLAVTVPAIIILSPVLLLVAIAIRLDSPGPILFRQDRIGRSNRLFKIMKFRSMRADHCDAGGNRSTDRDDKRVTRVGALIRKTSIDELPQLFNVLAGDMSLVGPRPHAIGSLAGNQLFWEVNELYWIRHALKPGITGLAQVRGYRGTTEQAADLENRLRADLEYASGWRLWRDISIMAATAKVLLHKNAY
ncbi:sugar transferase [Sphingobium sufflavum]|uniref:sugar transferase n=1 Tax=Sphingobium sufflavum TaxID=1129547 RepID=UPI001F1E2070|nr:sugar transferase [Sphingobium sufflavum]